MKKRQQKNSQSNEYCQLEDRKLLAVGAQLVHGNLFVHGVSEAPVEIQAIDQTTFEVTEGGETVATVEDVTGGIRVKMGHNENTGSGQDDVSIDLGGFHVQHVRANLGVGENSMSIDNGGVRHHVLYHGYGGDDSVSIGQDTTVRDWVFARLGGGDNTFNNDGTILGGLSVGAGGGDDTINQGENSRVRNGVFAKLRHGDNTFNQNGRIGGGLAVTAGQGMDQVNIGSSAYINRSTFLFMGRGDNSLNHEGNINGRLGYLGLNGNDTVNFATDARIAERTRVFLGAGENTMTSDAHIGSHLAVLSTNPDDSVSINEELVDGRVYINLDWGNGGGGGN